MDQEKTKLTGARTVAGAKPYAVDAIRRKAAVWILIIVDFFDYIVRNSNIIDCFGAGEVSINHGELICFGFLVDV